MASRLLDPLAQSFFITEPCIVTKVDLFFSAKDDSLPMYLHLRKNSGGLPGPYIIPFSETYVYPSVINLSSNANVATTVSFSEPIYLDIGEYSLTLGSDTKNYRVWVSELDQIDVTTNKRITEQPYIGSLFKSQNASTWTPVETEDLKFKLYRAVFASNTVGTIYFTPNMNEHGVKVLDNNPFEVFPDSTLLKVYHKNHGLSNGGYVQFSGLSNADTFGNVTNSFFGIPSTDIQDVLLGVSNVQLDSYTVILNTKANANLISSSTRFGGPSVAATQDIAFDTIHPIITAITPSNARLETSYKATSQSYSIDGSFNKMIAGDNDLPQTKIIAGNVTTKYNLANASSFVYRMDLTTTSPYTAPLIDTKQLGLVFARNLVDSPTYSSKVLSTEVITIANTPSANLTQLSGSVGLLAFSNASNQANARAMIKGTYINISGTNPNNGQFRVIDVLENGANVRVQRLTGNIVTDWSSNTVIVTNGTTFVAEEAATGTTAYSKYITRQIEFANDSTSINLRMDVCKPADASIEVYYKTRLVGETSDLASKEYTRFDGFTIPTSLSGEFYEIESQLDNLQAFNAVIFKVVFKSTNTAQAPKIRSLRAIALA